MRGSRQVEVSNESVRTKGTEGLLNLIWDCEKSQVVPSEGYVPPYHVKCLRHAAWVGLRRPPCTIHA